MATKSRQVHRSGALLHESFLRYRDWRWAKLVAILSIVLILIYALDDPTPSPSGGSVYGYTLGTIGALLILWLTALGYRKRKMTTGAWSLKAWTSAHVWLGLSLLVIGTLHTGFHFGWNVHTLAYALMVVVIVSGMFGVAAYAVLPARLSENRGERTEPQMLEGLRALDRQLHAAAQPLRPESAALVQSSLDEDVFAGSIGGRLRGGSTADTTMLAQRALRETGVRDDPAAIERIHALLGQKVLQIAQLRRHLRYRGLLEIWLYVHIPVTIALIAALIAHVVAVFFYW